MPFVSSVRGTFGSQSRLRKNWNSAMLSQVTGGSITTAGGYRIHRFDYTGGTQTFTPYAIGPVEIMAIAGGGSGGMATSTNGNGGGGAGGLVYSSALATTNGTPVQITIGAGASERGNENSRGNNGGNTTVTGLTTAIGGSGGSSSIQGFSQTTGGSGGGGAGNNGNNNTTFNLGTEGQGFRGGTGASWSGGGGGGAGSVGVNGGENFRPSCDGGLGLSYSISGSTGYYAGGGGGGGNSSESSGRGFYGGARGYGTTEEDNYNSYPNSQSSTTFGWRNIDAINGTGGGGGAGSYWMNNAGGSQNNGIRSGRGGHGVVIIRYLIP